MSRELDVKMAEALGLDVLGYELAHPDPECGDWCVGEWEGRDEQQPVYVRHCDCDIRNDLILEGYEDDPWLAQSHEGHMLCCLDVVPFYSTDIATAWGLVEKMVAEGGCPALVFDDNGHWALAGGGWQTVPMGENPEDVMTTFIIEASKWADSASEAICKEFLATYEEDDA